MRNKKGMSEAMWVLVVIIVALVVGVLVVSVFSKATKRTGEENAKQIEDSGAGVTRQSCEAKCASCKLVYGADCTLPVNKWDTMKGDCGSLVPAFTCT